MAPLQVSRRPPTDTYWDFHPQMPLLCPSALLLSPSLLATASRTSGWPHVTHLVYVLLALSAAGCENGVIWHCLRSVQLAQILKCVQVLCTLCHLCGVRAFLLYGAISSGSCTTSCKDFVQVAHHTCGNTVVKAVTVVSCGDPHAMCPMHT